MSSKGDDREIAVMRDWIEGSHLTDLPSVDSSEPTLAATAMKRGVSFQLGTGESTRTSDTLKRTTKSTKQGGGGGQAHCAQVLFKNYRDLCKQDSSRRLSTSALDPPKGLVTIFLLCCPCMGDMGNAVARRFSEVAINLWSLSWVLVLILLWLCRRLVVIDGQPFLAAAIVIAGIAMLLASEQVVIGRAERIAILARGVPSSSARLASTSVATGFAYYASVATSHSHSRDQLGGKIDTDKGTSTKAMHHPELGDVITLADIHLRDPGTAMKAIRQAIIRIEAELYGHEVSESQLSTSQLPHRVQVICDEVGVLFKSGGGVTEMMQALRAAQRLVGIQ